METIYLAGSSEVSSAGSNMRTAAEQMKQAASNIEYALTQHQRFLDDWLSRFEAVLTKENNRD